MDIFQNLLNKVKGVYKKADEAAGGWLPGGGIPSPVSRAMQPVKGAAKLANVRDVVLIPTLDKAMEVGLIPSNVGMFGRYLTGTSAPLTKAPADIRKAESWRAQAMPNPNDYIADDTNLNVYHRDGSTETNPFPKETALANSLGRYIKQNGIVIDRYNFDDYDKSGIFSLTGGVEQAGTNVEKTAQYLGGLAGKFGFIRPGTGYDVKLNLPSQPIPEIQNYRNISKKLSTKLNQEGDQLNPETLLLYQQQQQVEQDLKNKGIRIPVN